MGFGGSAVVDPGTVMAPDMVVVLLLPPPAVADAAAAARDSLHACALDTSRLRASSYSSVHNLSKKQDTTIKTNKASHGTESEQQSQRPDRASH